jgi:hypothetical protein
LSGFFKEKRILPRRGFEPLNLAALEPESSVFAKFHHLGDSGDTIKKSPCFVNYERRIILSYQLLISSISVITQGERAGNSG